VSLTLEVPSHPSFARCYPVLYKQGHKVIGRVHVYIIGDSTYQKRWYALIDDLVVEKEWRGQGLSKNLMRKAIEIAKQENCYKVIANSHKKRTVARALYRSMGFRLYANEFRLDL
jgi:GNAT superfamily N-acetyltransferase